MTNAINDNNIGNERISDNVLEMIGKYRILKDEISRMWTRRRVSNTSVVVGRLETSTSNFGKYSKEIEIEMRGEKTQKLFCWDN